MAAFVVGDVHGHCDALDSALTQVGFNRARDSLYCVGDLVNKGGDNTRVLDFFTGLGSAAVSVLGNHDMYLLKVALLDGRGRTADTIADVLSSSKVGSYIDWLRRRPFMHVDERRKAIFVHAGIPPQWDVHEANRHAGGAEEMLRGDSARRMLREYLTEGVIEPAETAPYAAAVLTNVRHVTARGRVPVGSERRPGNMQGLRPWFEWPRWRDQRRVHLYFGHWASLGGYEAQCISGIDTACSTGGALTVVNLDSGVRLKIPC